MDAWVWLLLALYLLYRAFCRCVAGKIVLAPGEGTLRVPMTFHPRRVEVAFLGCSHVPGCSQLEDSASVEDIDCSGFTIRYKVESGTRILKWRACK